MLKVRLPIFINKKKDRITLSLLFEKVKSHYGQFKNIVFKVNKTSNYLKVKCKHKKAFNRF